MALLKNKIFALVVCLISFAISGLIFADRVFGLSTVSSPTTFSQPINIPSPTNTSSNSPQAVNVSYLNSAGYLSAASNVSWSKLTSFPSSCSSDQYVSGIGASLTCSTPLSFWDKTFFYYTYYYYAPKNVDFFKIRSDGMVTVGDIPTNQTYSPWGPFAVKGYSTFDGGVTVNGGLSMFGNLSVLNGNVNFGNTQSSSGLVVYGNADIRGTLYASTKNFIIDHPLDPENKQLVHSSLEGPEVGVYYRGEAQLQDGKAEVVLPSYFEVLTRKENRTVLLTPKFDNFDEPVSNLAASAVENGKFKVRSADIQNSNQKFYWEVKAVRADIAPLEVERLKTATEKK